MGSGCECITMVLAPVRQWGAWVLDLLRARVPLTPIPLRCCWGLAAVQKLSTCGYKSPPLPHLA